jgi:hypothetical protein
MRRLFEVIGGAPAWEEVAIRHGLAAWVADELGEGTPAAVLDAARAQLAQSRRLRRLTVATLRALLARGVTPVLLKGVGLAERLYARPHARPATDVDVLLRPGELPVAREAMASLGLRATPDPGADHDEAWSGPAGLVELHFRCFVGFGGARFDELGLHRRAREALLDGCPVRYLAREDELLYLATHAAHHAFLRLSWLHDVASYVEREPVDWPVLLTRARAASCVAPLRVTLTLLDALFDVRPPGEVARSLASPRGRVERALFTPSRVLEASWAADRVKGALMRAALIDSPHNAVQYARGMMDRALRGVTG